MIQKFLTLSLIVTLLSNCALPVETNVSRRNAPAPLTQVQVESMTPDTYAPKNEVVISEGTAPAAPKASADGWHVALLVPQSGQYQALGRHWRKVPRCRWRVCPMPTACT